MFGHLVSFFMNCSLKVPHRMQEYPMNKWPNKFFEVGVCVGGVTLIRISSSKA